MDMTDTLVQAYAWQPGHIQIKDEVF